MERMEEERMMKMMMKADISEVRVRGMTHMDTVKGTFNERTSR